jgi:hypothetical protein
MSNIEANAALSDHQLQAELARQEALATSLATLATEHGLSWLYDPEAETIQSQAATAHKGYIALHHALHPTIAGSRLRGGGSKKKLAEQPVEVNLFEQLLEAKLAEWSEPDAQTGKSAFDFVREQQAADPSVEYRLTASPNEQFEPALLMAAAKAFGSDQPQPTWILDEDYNNGQTRFYKAYSAAELSGELAIRFEKSGWNAHTLPVRFELLPNKTMAVLANQTVDQQRAKLTELQAEHPAAQLHVPSVVTNLSRWHTLRAAQLETDPANKALHRDTMFEETYVRHFDLKPKMVGGHLRVPYSCVDDDGRPSLRVSFAVLGDVAVVAVG